MRIGVFDSGIGGLTVLKQAMAAYPHAHYIYFADTENVPYGTKTKKEIRVLVDSAVEFLEQQKIDLLILACNTATSVTVKRLRKKYDFPIVGMEPAVKPATEIKQQKKILVCATKLTLKQKKLKTLITNLKAKDEVKLLSLQKLVRFAENKELDSERVHKYLRKCFRKIMWEEYKAVVLGCTHFLFFRKALSEHIPPKVELIDGNEGTVNRMLDLLPKSKKKTKLKVSYFQSKKKVSAKLFTPFLELYQKN